MGLFNIIKWPPNAFYDFCLHVRVFSVTTCQLNLLISLRILPEASFSSPIKLVLKPNLLELYLIVKQVLYICCVRVSPIDKEGP